MITYNVDEKNRTVVCIIKTTYTDFNDKFLIQEYGKFVGKAICNDEDEFDIEKGKHIAKLKAILKIRKKEISAHEKACSMIAKYFVRKNNMKNHLINNMISLTNELSKYYE